MSEELKDHVLPREYHNLIKEAGLSEEEVTKTADSLYYWLDERKRLTKEESKATFGRVFALISTGVGAGVSLLTKDIMPLVIGGGFGLVAALDSGDLKTTIQQREAAEQTLNKIVRGLEKKLLVKDK